MPLRQLHNVADNRTFPIPSHTYSKEATTFSQCAINLIWAYFGATRAAFEQSRPFWAPLTCTLATKWTKRHEYHQQNKPRKGEKPPNTLKKPPQNLVILFVIDVLSRDLSNTDTIGRGFLNFFFSQRLGEKAPKLLDGCQCHFSTHFPKRPYFQTPCWTEKNIFAAFDHPDFFSQWNNFTGRKAADKIIIRPLLQFRQLEVWVAGCPFGQLWLRASCLRHSARVSQASIYLYDAHLLGKHNHHHHHHRHNHHHDHDHYYLSLSSSYFGRLPVQPDSSRS